ncbi:MAG: hypothetical protein HFG26_09050 [Provencibacterium sp.]|jgi:hypothetical protein|nr:hypothetical protein [Provencibacterium sp.]
MEFEEIVLTKEEMSALKALKKSADEKQGILVEPENKSSFERLVHFGLAEIQICTTAPSGDALKWPLPKAAYITERGRDYLVYLNHKKSERRSDRRHDVLLLLISALIAVFFDHLGDLFSIVRLFLDFLGKHQ